MNEFLIDQARQGNLYAARQLEDEIERRGLQQQYAFYLETITKFDARLYENIGSEALWPLIRATPEQRARAFLEAVKA